MLHPDLEKEREQNYPTIQKLLVENYAERIPGIEQSSIRAEARGNAGYGFHITLPGSQSPDFFFKIEKDTIDISIEQQTRTSAVHKFMEYLHDAHETGDVSIDSAKFVQTSAGDFTHPVYDIPYGLSGKAISLATNIHGTKIPLSLESESRKQKLDSNDKKGRNRIDASTASYTSETVEKMITTIAKLQYAGKMFTESTGVQIPEHEVFGLRTHDKLLQDLNAAKGSGDSRKDAAIQELIEFTNKFKDQYKAISKLPKGIVHTDLNALNFMQVGTNLVPIDMDDVNTGVAIYDVAKNMRYITDESGKIDPTMAKLMLSSYEQARGINLSPQELDSIYDVFPAHILSTETKNISKMSTKEIEGLKGFLAEEVKKSEVNRSILKKVVTEDRNDRRIKNLDALDLATRAPILPELIQKAREIGANISLDPPIVSESKDEEKSSWIDRNAKNTPKVGFNKTPGGSREI